jgi:hypothetical protein
MDISVGNPISAGINLLNTIIDRVVPDKNQAAKIKADALAAAQSGQLEELKLLAQGDQAQVDVNKVEAASTNVFVAGWRPFIGWICGAMLALQSLAAIMCAVIAFIAQLKVDPMHAKFVLDTAQTTSILMSLLGMGALRTMDKRAGVGNGH